MPMRKDGFATSPEGIAEGEGVLHPPGRALGVAAAGEAGRVPLPSSSAAAIARSPVTGPLRPNSAK